jgi:hypothetical protein
VGFISSPLFLPLRSFFSDTDGGDENGRARATGASILVPHRWETLAAFHYFAFACLMLSRIFKMLN